MNPGEGQAVCLFQSDGWTDQSRLDISWAGQNEKKQLWAFMKVLNVAASDADQERELESQMAEDNRDVWLSLC